MKILKLHLLAHGPFTAKTIDLGAASKVVVVHGHNEAGKSSMLRATTDLLFSIPAQSKDKFVHDHSEMRVGGEFVDNSGNSYALVRRKGRSPTLLYAEFDPYLEKEAAPQNIEALLNYGLKREDFLQMFGLDHTTLRAGGQALINGEGDVGAALFEASSGIRNIPQVINALDESARKFFMPGKRGKNALINTGLATYTEQLQRFKDAQIKPSQWVALAREHRTANEALQFLETQRSELNKKLLVASELRAVLPILSAMGIAQATLVEMQSIVLLPINAAETRATAVVGREKAAAELDTATLDEGVQASILASLVPDESILRVAGSVRRLHSSSEQVSQQLRSEASAKSAQGAEAAEVQRLAAQINVAAETARILGLAPSSTRIAELEEAIRSVEDAENALALFNESAEQGDSSFDEQQTVSLPTDADRKSFEAQLHAATSMGSDIARLDALPGLILSAQRDLQSALVAANFPDVEDFHSARPLLEATIDAAIKDEARSVHLTEGHDDNIAKLKAELKSQKSRRDQLLGAGEVATRADVDDARSRRDAGWLLVSGTYIDGTAPDTSDFAGDRPLAEAYRQAVAKADDLVDILARDTERATQLQACIERIGQLETDIVEAQQELEEQKGKEDVRLKKWRDALAAANLPDLAPAELREWQSLLNEVAAASKDFQALSGESRLLKEKTSLMAEKLALAITATGLASPTTDQSLSVLLTLANRVAKDIEDASDAMRSAGAREEEREKQRQQSRSLGEKRQEQLDAAKQALSPLLSELLLPGSSSVTMVRARLREFDDLTQAQARLVAAQRDAKTARWQIDLLSDDVQAVCIALSLPEPDNLRAFIDMLWARLEEADAIERERGLALNAQRSAQANIERHSKDVQRYTQQISDLCKAAAVESEDQLPAAEDASRRKRDAQDRLDEARSQLALASRRSIDELLLLTADLDVIKLDDQESQDRRHLDDIENKLIEARKAEEGARLALGAVDAGDAAIQAREAMEGAKATVEGNMRPWMRSKIAHALLSSALKLFRERAQGPMLRDASVYFKSMTGGAYTQLTSDYNSDSPVLVATRANGTRIHTEQMSEGTRDQLYLALRLAALDVRREAGIDLPLILDDVLITSDEIRSTSILNALAEFALRNQVLMFTHHEHVRDLAIAHLPAERLQVVELG